MEVFVFVEERWIVHRLRFNSDEEDHDGEGKSNKKKSNPFDKDDEMK